MAAARYWRAVGLQSYGGGALELSALHLYAGAGSGTARYWRFTNITVPGAYLEIGELQLLSSGVRLPGAVITASSIPSGGPVNDLNDNSVSSRCYWSQGTVQSAGFWLQFDFGDYPVAVDGVRQAGYDTSGRHISGFSLSYSNDGETWTASSALTGLAYPGNLTCSEIYPVSPPTSGSLVRVDMEAVLTSTLPCASGAVPNLQDGDDFTLCRWDGVSEPGFALVWDFGVGNAYGVDAVRLGSGSLESEFLERLTLQYSTEGSDWTTSKSFGRYVWPGSNTLTSLASPQPGTYQHWRVFVTAVDGSTTYASFKEVEFFETEDGTGTDLATSRIDQSQSGNGAVGPAGAAFDGNPGTEAGSSFPLPYWIYAAWAAPVTVRSIALSAQRVVPDRTAKNFVLQGSMDGIEWVDVRAHTMATGWGQYERRVFSAIPSDGISAFEKFPALANAANSSIALSGGMAGPAGPVVVQASISRDMQDGGLYRLYGTVELELQGGTPNLLLRRRVELWNHRDKRMVRETWSDATTGVWSFDHIRGGDGTLYSVVTYDHTGQKQARIADNLEPEAM